MTSPEFDLAFDRFVARLCANWATVHEADSNSSVTVTANEQPPVVRQLLDVARSRTPPRRLHTDRVRRCCAPIGHEGEHHD